jgi:hypothetical protein
MPGAARRRAGLVLKGEVLQAIHDELWQGGEIPYEAKKWGD